MARVVVGDRIGVAKTADRREEADRVKDSKLRTQARALLLTIRIPIQIFRR